GQLPVVGTGNQSWTRAAVGEIVEVFCRRALIDPDQLSRGTGWGVIGGSFALVVTRIGVDDGKGPRGGSDPGIVEPVAEVPNQLPLPGINASGGRVLLPLRTLVRVQQIDIGRRFHNDRIRAPSVGPDI